jgi:hypothetical protein
MRRFTKGILAPAILLLFATPSLFADDVYARVKGTVTDGTGAVVTDAQITATNTETGETNTITSRPNGNYEFVALRVGSYSFSASKNGFKGYKSTAVVLTVNENYDLTIKLEIGSASETVEVRASAVQVETTSIQQQTIVNSRQLVDLPLNGRNYTALEELAPGSTQSNDRFNTFSLNGSQSQQSSYTINGLDTNDIARNTPQIAPSPDAIQEFNLVTSTINPEYGRNSGGVVNALIKNGTNQYHGSVFDFYRDSSLNGRNFFSPVNTPPIFHQNQFGGTLGGPIKKDKTFFFLSYQGTYNRTGNNTGAASTAGVFSAAQRAGNFAEDQGALVSAFLNGDPARPSSTPVDNIVGDDGLKHPKGTPWFGTPGIPGIFNCGNRPTAANPVCTNPNFGNIGTGNFNPISAKLLNQFVPAPNTPGNIFTFNALNTLKSNQGIARIDHNLSQNDSIWGVYLYEQSPATSELPFFGATLPGFGQVDSSRTNDVTVAWNHTFNPTTLNEVRLGYALFDLHAVTPANPTLPSSFGFQNINPQNTAAPGLPAISVGGLFTLGFSPDGPQPRDDQTYQFTDNFSKIVGKHALKFGFDARRFRVDNPFFFNNNGSFAFFGAGKFSTGDPGIDFLLGFPDSYNQNSGGFIDARAYEFYGYFQDQWKARSDLTLTLGSGYDVETPYTNNQFGGLAINCLNAGQQSTVFPTAPGGLLFPGDQGCSNTGGVNTRFKHLAPRVGFAWAPNLGVISGSNNKFSIRGGFGVYYNRFEEETALSNLGAAPFGLGQTGAAQFAPLGQIGFANPFTDVTTGKTFATGFPFTNIPKPGQPVDFGPFSPLFPASLSPNLSTPYAMNFNLNIEREFVGNTLVSVGYVGSLGRHLFRQVEGNPETLVGQAACKVDPRCVSNSFQQSVLFPDHLADGASFPRANTPEGVESFIPSAQFQTTDGTSNYNSFQANVTKALSHGLQLISSYTWSHSIDNGSGFENTTAGGRGINLFDPRLNVGSSIFDARQRFTIGYVYQIPSLHSVANWAPDYIFNGWKFSGITTFHSGFPLNLVTSSSRSLFCSQGDSASGCPDNLNEIAPVTFLNPRTSSISGRGDFFFNPAAFANVPTCRFDPISQALVNGNVCGQFGNVGRDTLPGPGFANFDMAFAKGVRIRENTNLELGLEAFNVFNHTNFTNAGITTNIDSPNFGRALQSAPGRILQIRAKINF